MSLLGEDVDDTELESVVDRLTLALEVVSEKLSHHVLANHDQFVQGIDTVASVQDDLQSCLAVCQRGRATVRTAGDEVQRDLAIAEQTRLQQGHLRLLTLMLRLRGTMQLRADFLAACEEGDFPRAMEAYHETLAALSALTATGLPLIHLATDIAVSLSSEYEAIKKLMDDALQEVCSDFRPAEFELVLFGFLNDGSEGSLGDKIQAGYREVTSRNAARMVRSLLLAQRHRQAEDLMEAARSDSFASLCQQLPPHVFRSCLARVLEILFDVLVSYHNMQEWHALVAEQVAAPPPAEDGPAAGDRLSPSSADDPTPAGTDAPPADASTVESGGGQGPDANGTGAVDAAPLVRCLGRVADSLAANRGAIWSLVQRQVRELLHCEAAFTGEHFLQVLEWTQRFVEAGEAFVRGSGGEGAPSLGSDVLRRTIEAQSGKFFEAYHASNLRVLAEQLGHESWLGISLDLSSGHHSHTTSILTAMRNPIAFSCKPDCSASTPAQPNSFDWWLGRGNPFRKDGSPQAARLARDLQLNFGGQTSKYSRLDGVNGAGVDVDMAGLPLRGDAASPQPSSPDTSRDGSRAGGSWAASGSEDDDGAAERPEVTGSYIDEDSQTVCMREGDAGGSGPAASTSGQDHCATVSNAGYSMLKWMKAYAELLVPLSTRSEAVFQGMADLFEFYMLHVFMTFCGAGVDDIVELEMGGGVGAAPGLEQLAELVTPRLLNTLLRLLEAPYSPYSGALARAREAAGGRGLMSSLKLKAAGGAAASSGAGSGPPGPLSGAPAAQASTGGFSMAALKSKLQSRGTGGSDDGSEGPSTPNTPARVGTGHAGGGYDLRQGSIAIESLLTIGAELRAAEGALKTAVPRAVSAVDAFFNKSVDCIEDMQVCMFSKDAARLLQQASAGHDVIGDIGTPKCPYDHRDLPESISPWVQELVGVFAAFQSLLETCAVPPAAAAQIWQHAVKQGDRQLVDGFLRVKKCTSNGRMAMRLDMNGVIKGLTSIAPRRPDGGGGEPVRLNLTEKYIQAWFLPDWGGMKSWAMTEVPSLGKGRVMTVLYQVADRSQGKLKRKDVKELEKQLDEMHA